MFKNPQTTILTLDISGIGGVKTVHEGLESDGGKGESGDPMKAENLPFYYIDSIKLWGTINQ